MKSFRFIIVLFILMMILLFVYFLRQYLVLNKLQESFYGGAIEETEILLNSEMLEEPRVNPRVPMILGGYQNDVFNPTSFTGIKTWNQITYPLNGGGYGMLPFKMFGVSLGFLCNANTNGYIFSIGPGTNTGLPYFGIMIRNQQIILFMRYDTITSDGKALRPRNIPRYVETTGEGIQLISNLSTKNSDYMKIEIHREKKDGKDLIRFFDLKSNKTPQTLDITGFYVYETIAGNSLVYCGSTQQMAATSVHNLHMTKLNKLTEGFTTSSQIEPFAKFSQYIYSGFKVPNSNLNNGQDRRYPYKKTIDPLFNDGNKAKYIRFPERQQGKVSEIYTTYNNSGTAPESALIDVICQGGSCMLEFNGRNEYITPDTVKTVSIIFKPGPNTIILTNDKGGDDQVSVLLSCYTKTTPSDLVTGFTKSWSSETIEQEQSTNNNMYKVDQVNGLVVLPRENKRTEKIIISGFIKPPAGGSYRFNIIGKNVEFYVDKTKVELKMYERSTGRIEAFSNIREGFGLNDKFKDAVNKAKEEAQRFAEAAQRATEEAAQRAAAEAQRAAAEAQRAAAEAANRMREAAQRAAAEAVQKAAIEATQRAAEAAARKAAEEEAARKAAEEKAERERLAEIERQRLAEELIIDNTKTSDPVILVADQLVPYYIVWDGYGIDAPVDFNLVSYKKDNGAEQKIPDGMFVSSTNNGVVLKFVSDPDNKSWFYRHT